MRAITKKIRQTTSIDLDICQRIIRLRNIELMSYFFKVKNLKFYYPGNSESWHKHVKFLEVPGILAKF